LFTKDTPEATITNELYETIRNDKKHYTHIKTMNINETVYLTNANFVYLGVPYGVGQVVDKDVYDANTTSVKPIDFPNPVDYYYCYEEYKNKNGELVPVGTHYSQAEYQSEENVPNYQQYFVIQGKEPTETTTLYVSRESNAYDVTKEKIITVVYQYTYYEDEELDAFTGRGEHDYTPEEEELWRDILYTLQPSDLLGWGQSVKHRGLVMPAAVREEFLHCSFLFLR
jgi:hypothetical protein